MARQLSVADREKYKQNSPETAAISQANLKQGRASGVKRINAESYLSGLNIIEFATDILGLSFRERPAQEVLLRSLYGLPLSKSQLIIYKHLTGNEIEFEKGVEKTEGVFVLGARSGKSFLASIVALYESICRGHIWRKYMRPNEIGYVVIVATRLQQAQAIIGANCARMLESSRIRKVVDDSWATELKLKNGITIMSLPCNSTAGRGLPIVCFIVDEVAHFRIEGVNADETIYSSLRPRQAQFPGAKFLPISTPAAKQGLLWDFFKEGGQVAGRLTARASTTFMNPTIPPEFIERERRRNPDNCEREFDAIFAEQVDAFFPADKLAECFQLPGDIPFDARLDYFAAIDQSGLAGRDRFGFAIAHRVGSEVIVDCCRSWGTKDSDIILAEIKNLTSEYNIRKITTDKYASGWVRNAFEKIGLIVENRESLPVVYANTKSLVIAGRLLLPDNGELRKGLVATQAYYSRSNTLSIGHERSSSGHGDLADAVVTAIYEASRKTKIHAGIHYVCGFDDDEGDGEGFGKAYEAEWGNDESVWNKQG